MLLKSCLHFMGKTRERAFIHVFFPRNAFITWGKIFEARSRSLSTIISGFLNGGEKESAKHA